MTIVDITDFNQAIKINLNLVDAYAKRGSALSWVWVRSLMQQKAADLFESTFEYSSAASIFSDRYF